MRTPEEQQALVGLIWLEYLVRTEAFDRKLAGQWASNDSSIWLVAIEALPFSIRHSRQLHVRAVVAIEKVLERPLNQLEEAERVATILGLSHETMIKFLGDRSPINELAPP